METFALILAIEEYPLAQTVAKRLEGTTSNAERFVQWLEAQLGLRRNHILFCGSNSSAYHTHGTTRSEIKNAILQLIKLGRNNTARLYIYLSGHGVMIRATGIQAHSNILLSSDYVNSQVSGEACVQIEELTTLLSRCLGVGTHVSFVDACRTTDEQLTLVGLGLYCDDATSGPANWFQILSTNAGNYAENNSQFIDVLLKSLEGQAAQQLLERDANEDGLFWITLRSIHYALESVYALQNKRLEFRSLAESSDCSIRSTRVPGPTATFVSPSGNKVPPIELLTAYDEIIFLGETNGQLPTFLQHAFEKRGKRPWKRLDILSIDDLREAGRPGVPLSKLEGERQATEEYFKQNAPVLGQKVCIYRYVYRGTYGSMWKKGDGRRRVHASSRIAGMNIQQSPSHDFIDFAENRHPMVDVYFKIAHDAIEAEGTRCIFSHGEE